MRKRIFAEKKQSLSWKCNYKLMLMLILLIIGVLGWTLSVSALPIASSLEMVARSNAGGEIVTDTDSDAQAETINPLNVSVSALANFENATVLATGEGSATWVNPNQGLVNLFNLGWETENVESGSADVTTGTDWTYEFIADATSLFTLDFDITGSGSSTFGLNGFNFVWSGGPDGDDFFALDTSGTITREVIAGNIYTVNINNQANISGVLETRDAFMNGTFNWSITPPCKGITTIRS